MRKRRHLLKSLCSLALVTVLLGCATGKTFSELSGGLTPPPPGQGRIFIYRTIVLGFAVQPSVKLNGDVVGTAVPQGFFYVDRPAGVYQISTETEVTRTLSLTLEPEQVRYVRLGIGMGFFVGHVYPELVDDAQGQADVATCHYTGT